VLPHADPLHKVSIIPTGMALGVTQQLPIEDRHIYRLDYIEDMIVVRLGGRIAEELVFGMVSTGANDDLVRNTELARKMVREWGMSSRVGPMAWGSQGQVFLGEDLMHTRDYSDETARVIDEEVERILREQEDRCREVLKVNRGGLDLVARALLEHETIDGAEVQRLVDLGRQGADPDTVVTRGVEADVFTSSDEVPAASSAGDKQEGAPAAGTPVAAGTAPAADANGVSAAADGTEPSDDTETPTEREPAHHRIGAATPPVGSDPAQRLNPGAPGPLPRR
jgi:cell division protease FtsH